MTQSADAATAGPDDHTQILTVRGELDVATADGLYRRGQAAIGRNARILLLDLTGLSFCDARGLSAFVRIANEAEAAGCRLGLIAPQPLVTKMFRLSGLHKRLQVFATSEQARLGLGAGAGTARSR